MSAFNGQRRAVWLEGVRKGQSPIMQGQKWWDSMFRTLVSHKVFFKYSSDMIWFTFLKYALESGLPEGADG